MILGVTASRAGLSEPQWVWLNELVCRADELHHGACVGGDEAAHRIAWEHGLRIVMHPPVDEKLMMDLEPWRGLERVTILPPKDYLSRDRDIVTASHQLAVCPNGPWRRGSGTWYTSDYAESLGKVPMICYPDGAVEHGRR